MIRNNAHKYSVSAMCSLLQVPRSTYYYVAKKRDQEDEEITKFIIEIFKESQRNYGQRKIKENLEELGFILSRRRIGRIMNEQGLVSRYTITQFKPMKSNVNEEKISEFPCRIKVD